MGFGGTVVRSIEIFKEAKVAENTHRATLDGLDLDGDGFYSVLSSLTFNLHIIVVPVFLAFLFFNGDETLANYYEQRLTGSGTSSDGFRGNYPFFCFQNADGFVRYGVLAGGGDGYPRFVSHPFWANFYGTDPFNIVTGAGTIVWTKKENVTRIDICTYDPASYPDMMLKAGSEIIIMRPSK